MTNLQRIRKERGLSQSELSKLSDVPVRSIQAYEIGTKNINGCAALTVYKLAKALGVRSEEILEITGN